MRWPGLLLLSFLLLACGEESAPAERAEAPERPRVSRRAQEEALARCGDTLARIEATSTPTFARLMRECGGIFAGRACRDALTADTFSREAVAEACRADYCDELRPAPSFCAVELPTDEEFLGQFARFSRAVLRRDLRRIMDREGADEIAQLFSDLVDSQAARE